MSLQLTGKLDIMVFAVLATRFLWLNITPLGNPVVPLV
jgi:hypothetical protein